MSVPNYDIYWCNGCRTQFPLKLLKRCGACRIVKYCSLECQKSAWKGGHKKLCREVVVQKDLLKGWSGSWDAFMRWIAVRAFNLTNKPGNHLNRCLEMELKETGSREMHYAYEILDGHIKPLNIAQDVHFHSDVDEDDIYDKLYVALLVRGEDGEIIDALGLSWGLPYSIYDTPERSEIWARHYMGVAKSIVINSKPRRAIRDATFMMETAFLTLGKLELCSVGALGGRG